jgi:hypothetical protein
MQVTATDCEQKITKSLKEASDVITESSSAALQLHYLQTLVEMATSVVVLPLPIGHVGDVISVLVNRTKTRACFPATGRGGVDPAGTTPPTKGIRGFNPLKKIKTLHENPAFWRNFAF